MFVCLYVCVLYSEAEYKYNAQEKQTHNVPASGPLPCDRRSNQGTEINGHTHFCRACRALAAYVFTQSCSPLIY